MYELPWQYTYALYLCMVLSHLAPGDQLLRLVVNAGRFHDEVQPLRLVSAAEQLLLVLPPPWVFIRRVRRELIKKIIFIVFLLLSLWVNAYEKET